MANRIKLYDKDGNHMCMVSEFKNKIQELTILNRKGLYIRSQLNKAGNQVVSSYADFKMVTTEKFVRPFEGNENA